MLQIEDVESIPFKWGKKRGLGGIKKDVQFYESFTYDDVEYKLFDSVYMYMDGGPEPSIGKLIKIWEASDKAKKVKILWFFRPCEISNYIDVDKTLKNELFLASGEGLGLANVNPLEAIAGKCSVICILKDSRNPQPSHEELQAADFIFYRTFDVRCCLISDKIDDKIAGLDVKFLLNRAKKDHSGSLVPTESVPSESGGFTTFKAGGSSIDASSKEKVDHNLLSTNQKSPLEQNIAASGKDLVDVVKIDHARGHSVGDESKSKLKEDAELINSSDKQISSLRETSPSDAVQLGGVVKMNEPQKSAVGDKTDSIAKDKEIVEQKHSLVKQKSSLREKLPSDVDLQLGGVVNVNEVRKTTAKEDAELINSSVKQKSSLREHSPSDVGQFGGVVKMNEPQKSAAGDRTDSKSKDKEIAEQQRSLVKQKSSLREKLPSDADVQLGGVVKVNEVQKNTANDRIGLRSNAKEIVDQKHSLVKQKSSLGGKYGSNSNVELDERAKRNTQECSSSDKVASRAKDDQEDKDENNSGKRVPAIQVEVEEKVQATKDSGRVNDWPSKEAKGEGLAKASGENKKKIAQKLNQESHGIDFRAVDQGATTSENKHKRKFVNDLHGSDNISSKNPRLDKRLIRPANNKLPKASPRDASNDARNINNQTSAVTRRPTDKSKWFTLPPWEDRLQRAHENGTLVLLQNLDPSYAAAEVEDIVSRAFKENCAAKMIQQTALSSPHSGQAFVIFQTREGTEMVVTKLNEGCLLLPNGRPLVGRIATLNSPGKPSTFFGHIYVDKLRLQMQREKESVSTSHCSQPNTIEFDMAMDWRLLQERMDREWKMLYQQQSRELGKLQDNLSSK